MDLQTSSELIRESLLQAQEFELAMRPLPVQVIGCVGALILARAAWSAHMYLANQDRKTWRGRAHAMLAEVLDEAELLFTETEGRA